MLNKLMMMPVNGGDDGRGLILIGSRTCEFFRAGSDLLNELAAGYMCAVIDDLELEEMQAVIGYLKQTYTKDVMCPFLLAGSGKFLSGFNREVWLDFLEQPEQ